MFDSPRFFIFFIFIVSLSFAQASDSTEGGNITDVNANATQNSSWYGVCGQASILSAVPMTITAIPGGVECLTIRTGSVSCDFGVRRLNLLFSNSSGGITSLRPGDLTMLDAFINRPAENATKTFLYSSSFGTAHHGTLSGVPTTYTRASNPTSFPLGYLQDQDNNLVFITPVVNDQPGFNGSSFDFQLMLPTRDGTNTDYYVTVDLLCISLPPQGGGGTHTPYYNVTLPPMYECYSDADCDEDEYCDIPAGQPGGTCRPNPVPGCDIILYCGEWGPCQEDGYRYQPCTDLMNCSDITVYRVEKCAPLPPIIPPIIPEEIPTIVITPECPCLPLLVLLLLILLMLYLIKRRKDQKEGLPK